MRATVRVLAMWVEIKAYKASQRTHRQSRLSAMGTVIRLDV
jgi:hypothetical protein